jgi:hypothetical protein
MTRSGPLPMDTILDRLGTDERLPRDALAIMKAIYLAFEPLQACAAHHGWTETQLIDAAETARRAGVISISYDQKSETFRLKVTAYGKALTGWTSPAQELKQ